MPLQHQSKSYCADQRRDPTPIHNWVAGVPTNDIEERYCGNALVPVGHGDVRGLQTANGFCLVDLASRSYCARTREDRHLGIPAIPFRMGSKLDPEILLQSLIDVSRSSRGTARSESFKLNRLPHPRWIQRCCIELRLRIIW